jgi:hypothetical protein
MDEAHQSRRAIDAARVGGGVDLLGRVDAEATRRRFASCAGAVAGVSAHASNVPTAGHQQPVCDVPSRSGQGCRRRLPDASAGRACGVTGLGVHALSSARTTRWATSSISSRRPTTSRATPFA